MAIDWDKVVLKPLNDAFGDNLTQYIPASGAASIPALQGIFVDSYRHQVYKDDGSVGWNTTAPSFSVRVSDMTVPPAKNDKLIRNGVTYWVVEPRADGVGWLVLILKVM